jgi:histone-lysine N-methyltransferase SETMAR
VEAPWLTPSEEMQKGGISRKSCVKRLHDNEPAYKSKVAIAASTDCGFEILPHPPYSPDLALSDFYLFPTLKTKLRGRRYGSNKGVMKSVNMLFEDQNRVLI